jgi:hypothetical protein
MSLMGAQKQARANEREIAQWSGPEPSSSIHYEPYMRASHDTRRDVVIVV